jgi:hypothetical protein
MLSCLVVSYTQSQRPSGFKAIIKSIFKTNLPSLTSAPFSQPILSPFLSCNLQNLAKMRAKIKYICKKFINHQIKKCCYFAVVMQLVVIMQTLSWTNHSVRYLWPSAIFFRSVRMTTHGWWPTPAIFDEL